MTNKKFFSIKRKVLRTCAFHIDFRLWTKNINFRGSRPVSPPWTSFCGRDLLWVNFLGIFFFSGDFYEYRNCLPVPEMILLKFWTFLYHLTVQLAREKRERLSPPLTWTQLAHKGKRKYSLPGG